MSFDDWFKKQWKHVDPVTRKTLEVGSKYASKGVREVAHGAGGLFGGWLGARFGDLEDEADKNVDAPERGIGRAAASTALAYGAGAAMGAGAGGAGAGAGASTGAGLEGAGAAIGGAGAGLSGGGAAAGSGAGAGLGAEAGVVGAGGSEGSGISAAAGGGQPAWMNYMRMGQQGMKMMGGGGGQNDEAEKLRRQMRLAEIMRQSSAYTQSHNQDYSYD